MAQAGHVPGERRGADGVQGRERDVDGDAVGLVAGLEVVAQRQRGSALLPLVREVARRRTSSARSCTSIEGSKVQQVGPGPALLLPPGVEVRAGDDVGGDPRVVEVEQRLLVHHDVVAAGPVLELLGLLQEAAVGLEEAVPGVPLPLDQRMPDEQLAGHVGLVATERHDAVGDQWYAVQGDALVGLGRGTLLRPVRLRVRPLHQVTAQPLGPHRVDGGVLPSPQPARLDQLGGHHQVGLGLEQPGAREDREPRPRAPR